MRSGGSRLLALYLYLPCLLMVMKPISLSACATISAYSCLWLSASDFEAGAIVAFTCFIALRNCLIFSNSILQCLNMLNGNSAAFYECLRVQQSLLKSQTALHRQLRELQNAQSLVPINTTLVATCANSDASCQTNCDIYPWRGIGALQKHVAHKHDQTRPETARNSQ